MLRGALSGVENGQGNRDHFLPVDHRVGPHANDVARRGGEYLLGELGEAYPVHAPSAAPVLENRADADEALGRLVHSIDRIATHRL